MAKETAARKQVLSQNKNVETANHQMLPDNPDMETAAAQFFAGTEPIIRKFCKIPYFRNSLGVSEIYSISHTKLMQYFSETETAPDKSPAPQQLKRILYNELVNNVHRHETRCKYRQHHREEDAREDRDAVTPTELLPADSSCEPEFRVLREELYQDLNTALQSLKPLEQEVLRSLYYEGKSNKALAEEMKITPQYVSHLKKSGLAHLRNLLKAKYPEGDMEIS